MSGKEDGSPSGRGASNQDASGSKPPASGSKDNTKLAEKKLEKLKKKYEKRGVVYISRLPPHLVRSILQMHRAAAPPPALIPTAQVLDVLLTPDLIIPCLQKPQKLRHLLEQHATLGRLYLAPEGELSPLYFPVLIPWHPSPYAILLIRT